MSTSESSVSSMKQAQSVVTTDITQILIQSCLEIILEKLESFTKLQEESKTEDAKEGDEGSKEEEKEQPAHNNR